MTLRPRRYGRLVAVSSAAVLAAVAAVAAGAAAPASADDDTPVVLVQPASRLHPMSSLINGVNNDQWFGDSHGLWNPQTEAPNPDVVAKTARAGVALVRYPGGTPANEFEWKKAIGPQSQRGCQRDGRPQGGPLDSRFGPDEYMRFVTQAGAKAEIMVSFANGSAADAADWVEYMNAPLGTNPNGGTAWAQVRAANGHPEPYGVKYWEVGNEHYQSGNQRYWMTRTDTDTARQQYVFGGTQREYHTDIGQQVGRGCDFRTVVASDGTANQVFNVRFAPVVPGSAVVWVGGTVWHEVADLATAGPDDPVYQLKAATGEIVFGDGVHGRVPPAGADVQADYDSGPHPGFLDYYRRMKAADPSIDVCAVWADAQFPKLMADTGHAGDYDCVSMHPYTSFGRDFGPSFASAQQGHDEYMLGEAAQTQRLTDMISAVHQYTPASTYVAVSEFGALFFGPSDTSAYPGYITSMSHATYMASQWTRFVNVGLPWAEGNTLISTQPDGLRAVLGGEPTYVYTSEAVVRQAMRPLFDGGGTVVATKLLNDPVHTTEPTALGSSYQALVTTATVDRDGRLVIVVVNRDATAPVAAQVVPDGYRHAATARVSTVAGAVFTSFNSLDHPDDIGIAHADVTVGAGSFSHTFPPASVTVLELDPAA